MSETKLRPVSATPRYQGLWDQFAAVCRGVNARGLYIAGGLSAGRVGDVEQLEHLAPAHGPAHCVFPGGCGTMPLISGSAARASTMARARRWASRRNTPTEVSRSSAWSFAVSPQVPDMGHRVGLLTGRCRYFLDIGRYGLHVIILPKGRG